MVFIEEVLRFLTGFSFQLTVAALLFCINIKRRKYFLLRFIPTIVVYNAISYMVPGFYTSSYLTVSEWFSFSYPIMVLLLVGIICLCFEVRFLESLNFVAAAYAIQHIIFNGTYFVGRMFPWEMATALRRFINIIFESLLWCGYYFLFVRRFKNSDERDVKSIQRISFSVVTICVVYIINLWVRKTGLSSSATRIYAILCCLFLLVIQCNIFDKTKLQREKEMTLDLLQLSQKQYELNKENIDIINIKCHDLKHQIGKLKNMTDEEVRNSYIKETQKSVLIYDAFVKTSNEALDTVITEKGLLCEGKNIRFSNIIDGDAVAFMEACDIYSLFGNALDNAIECVEKVDESKRIISVNVANRGGMVKVHIDNYCNEEIVFENGLPVSNKSDGGLHGFGTKSIKLIAEKYGGNVVMRKDGERFCLDLLFAAV